MTETVREVEEGERERNEKENLLFTYLHGGYDCTERHRKRARRGEDKRTERKNLCPV